MTEMQITSAQYVAFEGVTSSIRAVIDGQDLFVPLDPANRHYSAILKAVDAGTLTIEEAV